MNHETAIALVGMSCRFPGARDVREFWHNLQAGVETITRFGADELLAAGVRPTLVEHPDFVPARGVIADGDRFDRDFFGYSPAEAATIDPQQRVFLECAAQAFDDAGIDPGRVGEWTGVYAGCDLAPQPDGVPGEPALATQRIMGREKDFLATRVAYKLDLRGPAITVQTACSTSLVAVHAACRALLGYECDVALAGGVSLRLPEAGGHLHQEGGILSRDGHCRPFDADADGTVNSNGAGVVVLKRLTDALEHNDRVIAVIRGSAVNNDGGEKVGYTAPSVSGQRDVIRMALAQAEVTADEIGYVETHGTGTPVGDPIELAALSAAFEGGAARSGHCLIGTVKANIGHTGAAAGVAGLIKAALMLQHGAFVPTPHFTRPNPALNLSRSPFRVSTEYQEWKTDGPRLSGVSSFGIGGTNAHLIVAEPPPSTTDPSAAPRDIAAQGNTHAAPDAASSPVALCVSAATPDALRTLREQLADRLSQHDAPRLGDVAVTLTERRQFPHRVSVIAENHAQAAARLRAAEHPTLAHPHPTAAFLFPGQGTLRAGHGRAAHTLLPAFRDTFDACRARSLTRFSVDLSKVLDPGTEPAWFHDTRHQQLGLFVLGYALAHQLAQWDVTPAAMLGHSIGEIVAATVAGVWSWEDALELVWERGTAMHQSAAGSMLALRLPPEAAAPLLGDGVSLAVAGSDHVVLAGSAGRIEEVLAAQQAQGHSGRLLDTAHAFHSPLMADAAGALRRVLADMPGHAPQVPFLSNVTGTWTDDEQVADPGYWADQLLSTVKLGSGLETLTKAGTELLIELGPGDRLTREAARLKAAGVPLALLGNEPKKEPAALLSAVAHLWAAGVPIPWVTLRHAEPGRRCSLPPHPFARTVIPTPAARAVPPPTQAHAEPPPTQAHAVPPPTQARPASPPSQAPSSRAPATSATSTRVTTPTWIEATAPSPHGYDAVLLVGDADDDLIAVAAEATKQDRDRAPEALRISWSAADFDTAWGTLTAQGTHAPLLIAAVTADIDPGDPGTAAVLDVLLAAARRCDVPLLLAGRALTDMPAESRPSAGATALAAWVEHHNGNGVPVALLDLGTADAPRLLPLLTPATTVYAWRGRRWWARGPHEVQMPATPHPTTPPTYEATRWTLVTDGRPDGARLAADLAENGLPLHAFVDLTPPPERGGVLAEAVANAPWRTAGAPLTRRPQLSRDLDRYCAGLVGTRFLAMTGLSNGARITDEEIHRRIDPERRFSVLVDFCLRMLAEEGWLRPDDGWLAADDITDAVAAALASGGALGELPGMKRVLEHITDAYPAVFAGQRSPVSVLYPDAEGDFLQDCLKDNRILLDENSAALDALRSVVRAITARRGGERPVRILEIGAGTGRLTWPLLTDWPERDAVDYHVTDTSPLIVRRAQARATELALRGMRFSTYDIGRDPVAQGLVPGSYDLVLGYNVVHVAPSIPAALRHLRSLLRPGGHLGLVEVTQVPRWSHVLWGLAPGWWEFADELRKDSIHLGAEGWLRALGEAGFTPNTPVPASVSRDHLVVLSTRPTCDDTDPTSQLRHAVDGLSPHDTAENLLYLPDLDSTPQAAARWEKLHAASSAPSRPAWVITEDPAQWHARQERRRLDPAPDTPGVRHLELTRMSPVGVTALLRRPPPPGVLRLTGTPSPAATPDEEVNAAAGPAGPVTEQPAAEAIADVAQQPRDALSTAVAKVWCDVLGTSTAVDHDDFHRLGGDSLMLVQLVGLVRSRLNRRVDFAALATGLTFADLVAAVRQSDGGTAAATGGPRAPSATSPYLKRLRSGESRTPLFLIPPAAGSSLCYRELASHLDESRVVYGVESPGLFDGRRPLHRLADIAEHHLQVIREVQPHGPYLLAGWSLGAMVAIEMTRQIEAAGEQVGALIGIDGFLPATRGLPLGMLPSWLLASLGLWLDVWVRRGRSRMLGAVETSPAGRDDGRKGEVARIAEVATLPAADIPDYVRVHNAGLAAMLRHRPRPIHSGLLLLKAGATGSIQEGLRERLAPLYGAGVTVQPVEGDHWTLLGRRHSPALAAQIHQALSVGPD